MSHTSRLLDLANSLHARIAEIQKHLSDTGKLDPTFDGQEEPTDWTDIDDTRAAALEDLTELRDLLSTPRELVYSHSTTDLLSRHAFDRFDVYEAVPLNSPHLLRGLVASHQRPRQVSATPRPPCNHPTHLP